MVRLALCRSEYPEADQFVGEKVAYRLGTGRPWGIVRNVFVQRVEQQRFDTKVNRNRTSGRPAPACFSGTRY